MVKQVKHRASETLSAELEGYGSVLVLTPSFGSTGVEVCTDLLAGDDPGERTVLAVTYRQSAQEWVERWYDNTVQPPKRGIVVGVGDGTAADLEDLEVHGASRWSAESVDSPADLTGLGIRLSDHLDSTAGPVRLCFDSLTALLQYTDLKPAFQFCHALTGRVKGADAAGHYHLDPAAHDDRTLATIMGLFDASVEYGDDEWTIRTR
ncbi:DUF7504 family protein [Halorientalis marina]|jgi:hypothetical protein|uniref:DUF7504 family protein n=1 Tax=Halorientalis marina TaxID=2931976 RepID=UPI001FF57514|nr:hypothetical protein [Halorientalis marina]